MVVQKVRGESEEVGRGNNRGRKMKDVKEKGKKREVTT